MIAVEARPTPIPPVVLVIRENPVIVMSVAEKSATPPPPEITAPPAPFCPVPPPSRVIPDLSAWILTPPQVPVTFRIFPAVVVPELTAVWRGVDDTVHPVIPVQSVAHVALGVGDVELANCCTVHNAAAKDGKLSETKDNPTINVVVRFVLVIFAFFMESSSHLLT
jgi:hypothetical protein